LAFWLSAASSFFFMVHVLAGAGHPAGTVMPSRP
jgi:hypothetical protein